MDAFPKLILVPTDFSEVSGHALRYAAAIASRTGAHLLVLHACGFDTASAYFDNAEEDLLRHVEENVGADVLFDVRVVTEPPSVAITNTVLEAGCDLVVMGAHGRTGFSHFLFGSVTDDVVRMTTVPVIAVPPRAQSHGYIGRVLCPVDFTAASQDGLRKAAQLVENRRAPLVLLRPQVSQDDLIALRKWIPSELVDRCELKVVSLADSQRVARIADETYSDLIVLSVPENRSITEVLGGTFSEHVVHESRCPVLLVREVPVSSPLAPRSAETIGKVTPRHGSL